MASPSISVTMCCLACLAAVSIVASTGMAATWEEVQVIKRRSLESAAKHAMEQQKTDQADAVPIPFGRQLAPAGTVKVTAAAAESVALQMEVAPRVFKKPASESIRVDLAEPIDMVARHSGLALIVKFDEKTSPEVRMGCRLTAANGDVAEIEPMVPVRSAWGENPHEVYLDWAFLNYADVEAAVAVLKDVKTIELTFSSSLRAPVRGASKSAQPANLTLEKLRLVDYLKGSFDPSRQWLQFDKDQQKWVPGKKDLTLMHRTQEVTGIVAGFGGDAGAKAAVDSLDMALRTQCWDGSFLDGRRGAVTVTSGEYTFGFTIYGLLTGFQALEQQKSPALDEKITLGTTTLTRREACQRMFYRGAMARTAAKPTEYRDDIIGGDTLMAGANRVLGYAIAMRMVADALTDPAQKKQVLDAYQPIMQQIADAQGKYSGGFPLLGEGNKYQGKGIHYDGGYTRTHMDWLVVGVRRTGDPLLVQMLQRYQTVFEAVMNEQGTGLKKLISERHAEGGDVRLILPDATAQVGLQQNLPIIAQWGYNVGMPAWENWEQKPGNHFSAGAGARGYGLGAHMSVLIDDVTVEPKPKELGYLFPRQYPIWSSRLLNKEGVLQRTSSVTIAVDGNVSNDFKIEVGEYPVTVGVPVTIKTAGAAVTATADKLDGWPKLLPADATLNIQADGWDKPKQAKIGEPIDFKLNGKLKVTITGPEVTLPKEAGGAKVPFRAELTLAPAGAAQAADVSLTVHAGLPAGQAR